MKKIIVIFIVLVGYKLSFGSEIPKLVKSNIKNVTVFLSGAQVNRLAIVNLDVGTNYLKFNNISADISAQSIQVKGSGKYTLLSVSHGFNYLDKKTKSIEIEKLKTEQIALRDKIDMQQSMLVVYNEEEKMLLVNKSIGGQQEGVKIAELKEGVSFLRERLTDVKLKQLEINKSLKKYKKQLKNYDFQLRTLNSDANKPTSEIIIVISSKIKTTTTLSLSYIVKNAGWIPIYDIRAKDIETPVQLNYKAEVFQSSGNDWNKVKLKLSTANPYKSGQIQELNPWYLQFQQYRSTDKSYGKRAKSIASNQMEIRDEVMEEDEIYDSSEDGLFSGLLKNKVAMVEHTTNIEFDIDAPYTIPSDSKKYSVDMQSFELTTDYEYACVPKLDEDAFLIARITEWENYHLLRGTANLFFEGTFVGQSMLDVSNVSDTLKISLGRDNDIKVKREKVKEFSIRKVIGTSKIEKFAYRISVRNNKKTAIKILISDQMPLSTNKQIEVDDLDYPEADYNLETGLLKWRVKLEPQETKKFDFKYEIKFPKNKTLKP